MPICEAINNEIIIENPIKWIKFSLVNEIRILLKIL